jgi:protoporphyrinogen/coproporphyrinogen III oxidase
MNANSKEADVVVVGGGLAGLGAALRLQDRGLKALVLEAEHRVGGRMTTDRVEGFVIDRGATLLGNGFHCMKRLVNRLGLADLVRPGKFPVGIQHPDGVRSYRGGRFDDLLLDRRISWKSKRAFLRFSLDLVRHCRALTHGRSDCSAAIDSENAYEYFQRLGGEELFESVFKPGLKGPVGGSLNAVSRAIVMQTIWNILVRGVWSLTDGLDRIPESIAAKLDVRTGACVNHVEVNGRSVKVEASIHGKTEVLEAAGVILAIPGQFVPKICSTLPEWLREPLARTRYSRMVNAGVALRHPPRAPYAGYGFADGLVPGAELELEHLRAPNRCPGSSGMVSVFLWDTPERARVDASDESLKSQAVEIVERTFPETRDQTLFVHLVRWDPAIAHFPAGRLREMIEVRRRLGNWDAPMDVCGDYLDGISSEGALRTGEQAGDRLAARLKRN